MLCYAVETKKTLKAMATAHRLRIIKKNREALAYTIQSTNQLDNHCTETREN